MKYRKNTESKNPKVVRTKNGRIIILSKDAVSDSEKSKFIKEQEVKNQNLSKSKKLAGGLLSSVGITTPLS